VKKLLIFIIVCVGCIVGLLQETFALPGDMGFFGGISEGRRLPKTMETFVSGEVRESGDSNQTKSFPYKEVIFLTGRPVVFTGVLEVSGTRGAEPNSQSGNYTQTMRVYPSTVSEANADDVDDEDEYVDNEDVEEGVATIGSGSASIDRTITYSVNYRREGNQLIKDYTVQAWAETISVNGITFTLDSEQSGFDVSIIEHETPGIGYYRGDISARSVYTVSIGGEEAAAEDVEVEVTSNETRMLDVSDSFYGYTCAWSKAEVHRVDATVSGKNWQMMYQVRPGTSASKTLWYTKNEPDTISFEGNYKEVLKNHSGLKYKVLQPPIIYPDQKTEGGTSIPTRNTFEQLMAPDVGFLTGHPAMEDIRKLFSMQILDGDPLFYLPEQAITRAQFVDALTKAIKLPTEPVEDNNARGRRNQEPPPIVFPDVLPERPDYPCIMSAYRTGIAIGRNDGTFYADSILERQEAIVMIVRALGITNLGHASQTTIFTDDEEIAYWARQSFSAASRLGIIKPDQEGRIRPRDYVSKAEAAALVRSFVDYMRIGIASDYAEHIVNYVY